MFTFLLHTFQDVHLCFPMIYFIYVKKKYYVQIISDITSTLMFRNVYDLCMKFHIPNSSGSFVIAIKPKWKKLAAFRFQIWWVSFVRTFTVGISQLNILGFDTASMAAYNFLNHEDGGSTFLWNVSVNLQIYMESKHQRYNQKFHENIIMWCIYIIFILSHDVDPNIHHAFILII